MRYTDFRYWVLWMFLLGILVIVFLQVLSGYNINRLIQGNAGLLNEIRVQREIRQLEEDVLTVESDIRGAVITEDSIYLQNLDDMIGRIDSSLTHLTTHAGSGIPGGLSLRLQQLVSRKLAFSRDILRAYQAGGKSAAEQVINTNQGKFLRDSISQVITQLEAQRQSGLGQIVSSNERTGMSARLWGAVITAIALLALVLSFWYQLTQSRQQQKLISKLNESDRRSREVADMKEQFLANMSHEIRTPMNAILGFTSLLRRSHLSQEQRVYVQNIHSAGENLLALVNDVLDLSKIEAGMMYIEEVRFSLNSLVGSVAAMFTEKVREKNLHLDVNIDQQIPDILSGDAVRLTQILVNLLSNAVKFTERGGIRVEAELLEQEESSVRIRFRVADTGIGIAPEKLRTVFHRFHQAEAETTRRYGGTGLGLAIVKQLVELQKGSISVESTPGRGSVFTVEIGYGLPDVEQMFTEALAAQQVTVPIRSIRVLIAEDHPMNQQLIEHLMKSWGIDHMIVSNGQEAVDALKKEKFSVVLMDIQMPVMDGYTAVGVIRNEMKSDIPVIAMTAHAMVGEKEKCLQLGMNDYVSKPIKETVLYNMIARHAQHPGGEPRLVNLQYLHQLSGNDREFEKQILKQFLEQTPQELDALRKAIVEDRPEEVRRYAHTMKSTVGYIGLSDSLHPVLDIIESSNGNRAQIKELYDLVREKCEKAMQEIRHLLSAGE